MSDACSNTALLRIDQAIAEADLALSVSVPSVRDMRVKADHITSGRIQIEEGFVLRLDYDHVRNGVRGVTTAAIARARTAEATHLRLRRRLFWRLIWVRYRAVFWVLLSLGILSALGWTLWLWRVEIVTFLLPPPVPNATLMPASAANGPMQPPLSLGQTFQMAPAPYLVGPQ